MSSFDPLTKIASLQARIAYLEELLITALPYVEEVLDVDAHEPFMKEKGKSKVKNLIAEIRRVTRGN